MAFTNLDRLVANICAIASFEGGKMWFDRPCRWYDEGPRWRCENDHVSVRYLKSEEEGDVCLACRKPLVLTFPEDKDGPLEHEALRNLVGK